MNNAVVFLSQLWLPRRDWYRNKYLRSNHWRRFRAFYGWLMQWRCAKCGRVSRHNDVHHTSYDHLWLEWIFFWEMRVMCRECHDKEHDG